MTSYFPHPFQPTLEATSLSRSHLDDEHSLLQLVDVVVILERHIRREITLLDGATQRLSAAVNLANTIFDLYTRGITHRNLISSAWRAWRA
ncbi:hypothetical protein CONLIGDRAFT_278441 [Coniochaeta ligniaria NRRL 30616]|uniref:Uncharacterized protein n=1 Tax=Coniochaeta ligniaria NRRL 30616 TaxID=1408157 RepID=A0A1J7IXH6_9PEZI|nr:hypothetical protein CONLIGDRAFT_278441 [Coniochaeta ligniaria NRRL 30616]